MYGFEGRWCGEGTPKKGPSLAGGEAQSTMTKNAVLFLLQASLLYIFVLMFLVL